MPTKKSKIELVRTVATAAAAAAHSGFIDSLVETGDMTNSWTGSPDPTGLRLSKVYRSVKKSCSFCIKRKRYCDGFARKRCRQANLLVSFVFLVPHTDHQAASRL